jgi:4-hydroxy-4-methyl-2-oxoglutarate aldolase
MATQTRSGPTPAEIPRLLLELGAATVGEAGGIPMHPRIKAAWTGATIAAPAFPVRCEPGDNLAVHVAVAQAPPGSVLVVDASARPELGYWGEVLTTAAEQRGILGLVIDGGVRDVAALAAHGFPVFSALVALPGATKLRGGAIGQPALVGGVRVAAGDWVVGDADGVAVAPAGALAAILTAGRERAEKERAIFARLRTGGVTTVEIFGLDVGAVAGAAKPDGERS